MQNIHSSVELSKNMTELFLIGLFSIWWWCLFHYKQVHMIKKMVEHVQVSNSRCLCSCWVWRLTEATSVVHQTHRAFFLSRIWQEATNVIKRCMNESNTFIENAALRANVKAFSYITNWFTIREILWDLLSRKYPHNVQSIWQDTGPYKPMFNKVLCRNNNDYVYYKPFSAQRFTDTPIILLSNIREIKTRNIFNSYLSTRQ